MPRDLVARARIQTESEELSRVQDARVQAVLAFELGALHEHGLDDPDAGAQHYLRALAHQPAFRPALFALARVYADAAQPADGAGVWQAIAGASATPAEAAAALCTAGLLRYDRLGERERAVALWDEALALDPTCLSAALLLEQHHRAAQAGKDVQRAVAAHARGVEDPAIEAALRLELAAAEERAGDPDAALAQLARATELAGDSRSVWYETERVARRHGRSDRLREALDALTERAQENAPRSAARAREAGRLISTSGGDAGAARARYDRALELVPGDALALWERAFLQRALGEPAWAAADVRTLIEATADPALAAAGRARLAELLSEQGDAEGACRELIAAAAEVPDSAAITAALEDALLRTGRLEELRNHVMARAELSTGPARAEHLLRASRIALVGLWQPGLALKLLERAIDCADAPEPMLRARWATAVLAGNVQAACESAERLCQGQLDPDERSLLRFDQYHRLRSTGDDAAVLSHLSNLLHEPEVRAWAAHAARVHASGAHDHALLAQAHRALAELSGDEARAAAHLCAAARALAQGGEPRKAAETAREALARAPDDAYALALLEECLLASGGGREAAEVLRDAARAHASGKQRELALLHAGAAAEAGGDVAGAARSYDEAGALDPGALAPRWALRRLAERTRDAGLLLRALELLAQHEAEFGGSGLANLELGEALGAQGLATSASAALRTALGRGASRAAAAFELCLLPEAEIAADLRDEAVAALAERCDGPVRLALLRDGLAVRLQSEAPVAGAGARALLDALSAEHAGDAGLALLSLSASGSEAERADALLRLASATRDPKAAAEFVLHGLRLSLLARGADAAEENLMRALAAAQAAPASHAAAVALDEALWAGDDAESRFAALSVRLRHSSAETSRPLRAARARALLAAGRAAEAADAVDQALAYDPDELGLWELKRATARARGDWETAAEAAERLALAASGRFRTELLEEAAVLLQNELGQNERAERCLRAAFAHDPESDLAFAWLHDLLLERRELPDLLALLERRAEASTDAAEQVDLAYERALVLRALSRKEEALAALEPVLAREPHHVGALGLRVEACTAAQRWPEAVASLQALAAAAVPDAQKRLAHLGAADFLERRLGDLEGACDELEAVCALGPNDRELLARLAELYQRVGRYRKAAQSYVQAAALASGTLAAELERRAGAVLHDPLGALGDAVDAYARALAADPLDAEACARLLALEDGAALRERVLSDFGVALDAALARDPLQPALLRKLRRLGVFRERRELEWVALCALRALHLLDADEAGALAALEPAVHAGGARLRIGALAQLGAALEATPIARAAQLVADALAKQAGRAAPNAVDAQLEPDVAPEARFELGARALAAHLGVLPLFEKPRSEQRAWLRAAAALAGKSGRAPEQIAALGKRLSGSLTRAQRKELARMFATLAQPERELDAYLDALEAACTRAGMLAADDPRPALARALSGSQLELEVSPATPQALALSRFWVSPAALALRRELGWSA